MSTRVVDTQDVASHVRGCGNTKFLSKGKLRKMGFEGSRCNLRSGDAPSRTFRTTILRDFEDMAPIE